MAGLIVHEWLEAAGGAEKVVDEFRVIHPEADLFVLWNDAPWRYEQGTRNPIESWVARTPLRKNKAIALPFLPATWRHPGITKKYEWLLVSSHLFAHHVRAPDQPGIPKYVYAHTPARYIWQPDLDARGGSLPIRLASSVLKPIDRRRAKEATSIAANSEFTRARISRTWQLDATVIYPPVDTSYLRAVSDWRVALTGEEQRTLDSLPSMFILGASRLVQYKRLDLVIAAGEAADVPVVIAGGGPDLDRLRQLANDSNAHVIFLASPTDQLLHALYAAAAVYVFPAVEDFGIMPVEAMACGTPAIVANVGGAAESVEACNGGVAIDVDDPDWDQSIRRALDVDTRRMRKATEKFSRERFQENVKTWAPIS